MQDGTIVERTAGTPQGGVISPVLANLFMHYVFDDFMSKEFPTIQWVRYADDGVLNCVQTKAQAPSGCTGIETELVKNLAMIVNDTNARIILTSDWKVEWETVSFCCSEDAKYLNEMLAKEGLQIVGKTYDDHVYDYYLEDRGRGIHRYLDALENAEG